MNAREIAVQILSDIEQKETYANIALSHAIARFSLAEQDRRFLTELVYGTLKALKKIDWIIAQFASRPLAKMPIVIRNILRVSVYQLMFLDRVPVSAACNQGTEMAKKHGHQGTGKFVNGILRTIVRQRKSIKYPEVQTNPIEYIAIEFSHPEWLIRRWVDRFGVEETIDLCKANNHNPKLAVRTNTLLTDRSTLQSILEQEGITCQQSLWTPEGLILEGIPSLNGLKALQSGLMQVQDESSMLVAHVVKPEPGELVIDACGAPGGKTTHMAQLMNNKGKIIACDIYHHKLKLLAENCQRLQVSIVETLELDAVRLHDHYANQADRVLVDAPCSGLGVLRRKPDSRWRKHPEMLHELPFLQRAILESAAYCVKEGGTLVYSTCTTEPEENQEIINSFLNSHSEFSLEEAGCFLPTPRNGAMVQLYPHRDNVDGFFIARMHKRGN